nr:probable WRKY transcription factor 13 isoform X1 [Ipomoea trifida]
MSSSSTTSQAMLNQILFQDVASSSSSLFCVSSNNNNITGTGTALPFESLKTLITVPMPTSLASLLPPLVESSSPNSTSAFNQTQTQTLLQQHQDLSPLFGPPHHHQLLSLHRSAPNLCCEDEEDEQVKKEGERAKVQLQDHE